MRIVKYKIIFILKNVYFKCYIETKTVISLFAYKNNVKFI